MATATTPSSARLRDRPWWPWAKRIAAWAFLAIVAWLIVDYARKIDWDDVWTSVTALPRGALLGGLGIVLCSYLVYCTYDLLGRHLTGHALPTLTVMGVTYVAYSFNMNFGSLVGTIGLRVRLYSRLGLDNATIARVVGFSMFTNWYGYLGLAGAVFAFGSIRLPPHWKIDDTGLHVVGWILMTLAAAYLVLCAVKGEHVWRVRGHDLETPTWRMALLQLVIAATNWSLMAAVIWVLLQGQASYTQVLAVFLVAAIAGLVTHVPGGLGVIEAVFIALLGHAIPEGRLLGALLAYRALYYLLPLTGAMVLYFVTEARARKGSIGA